MQTAQGKLYLFVAIDRASKSRSLIVDKANTPAARAYLEALVAAVPYRIEIVLTDNGIQFADLPKNRSGPTAKLRGHPFDRACREHKTSRRLSRATPSAASEHHVELIGFPISMSFATFCVCLELRSLPSAGVTRFPRYYEPLRHPRAPGLSLAGVRLILSFLT